MTKRALVFWLTGLSGSGKSTIANKFEERLCIEGKSVKILDGDEIRAQIHSNLGFSPEDIKKNNKLIAELCLSLISDFDIILVSVISPFHEMRQQSREIIGENYVEVYVEASLDTVISRDVKGLYEKALNGEIEDFIGISTSTPYEVPGSSEITVNTEEEDVEAIVDFLMNEYLSRSRVN